MAHVFKKQARVTLKSSALNQIKKAILSGDLKPGDRIIETRLAKEMGISKFPIREALRYLEKEGLVVNIPYKGTRVRYFDEKDIEEVYTLRAALEELAIRLLMTNANGAKFEKLDSILRNMQKAVEEKRTQKLLFEDMLFHRTICELSGHRRLLEMWATLEHQIESFIALEEYFYEPSDPLVEEHYFILKGIKSGDTQFAENSIRNHLKSAVDALRKVYKKSD